MILISLSFLLLGGAIGIAAIDWQMLPLTLFLAYVSIFLLYLVTSRFRNVPQNGLATFGDIAKKIVGLTFATADLDLPDDTAILSELRPIVVGILGVDADEIVPSARFVEDLSMG